MADELPGPEDDRKDLDVGIGTWDGQKPGEKNLEKPGVGHHLDVPLKQKDRVLIQKDKEF